MLLYPAPGGAGTFTEDFTSVIKKSTETTANWDTANNNLTLSTTTQKPLQDDESDISKDDASERGYRFKALYDGKITALGRFRADDYSGNTKVRLWSDDGTILSSTTVPDTSGWSFADISPVKVSSGTYYRVSVICKSSRTYFNTSLPTRRNYLKLYSAVKSTQASGFPSEEIEDLWGAPDIKFVSEYIYPSTGVSKGYDTLVSDPLYLNFTSSETLNGGSVDYSFSDSPDNSSWSEWTSDVTGLSKRYLRWKAVLDSTTSSKTPVVHNLEFNYNCPPQTPTVFSPEDLQPVNTLRPEFVWENSYDEDGDTPTYKLRISTNTGFSPVYFTYEEIAESELNYSSFTITDEIYHSPWYWQIKATDTYSDSAWTSTYTVWVDTVPPDQITDLQAQRGTANGEIDIEWTEPGDTGKTETISEYLISYATYNLTEALWSKAPKVSTPPEPSSPEEPRNYTVTGLEDDRAYYLGIKTKDDAGNRSQISNIAVSSTNFTPEIELIHPTDGVAISSNVTIRWDYRDVNPPDTHSFDIMLSDDGGATYDTEIASNLSDNTTYYEWYTLEVPNATYWLKVTAEDNMGLSSQSVSSATVDNANVPPEVSLNRPDGGETYVDTEEISWDYDDINPVDEIHFDILISTDGKNSWITEVQDLYLDDGLTGGTTNYSWDTTAYPDGHRYRVQIRAYDNMSTTGTAISNDDFIVFNNNHPPEEFSLISPAPEEEVKILYPEFNWEDSDDQDIPKGDSFTYRLYYSQYEDFSRQKVVEDISGSSYTLKSKLKDFTRYWWKVSAIDEFDEETFNTGDPGSFYVRWAEADSEDEDIIISGEQNLPEDGYFDVNKTGEGEDGLIKTADNNAIGDPRLRTLDNNTAYNIQVKDRETDAVLSVNDLSSNVTMKYVDADNDNYLDCCDVNVKYIRIFRFSDDRWELASTDQVVNTDNNTVTARDVKSLSIFAVQLYSPPDGHLSEVRNFPNPFRAGSRETEIVYTLNEDSQVTLDFYTITGDLVYTKDIKPGENGGKGSSVGYTNRIPWKGYNGNGRVLADGIYILSVTAKGENSGTTSREKRLIGVVK
ncbi:MAG: DUF4082 domain-containing protein [Elusimicrobiota bacterium]